MAFALGLLSDIHVLPTSGLGIFSLETFGSQSLFDVLFKLFIFLLSHLVNLFFSELG